MLYQPGKSGNPGGRSRLQVLSSDLRKLVTQSPNRVRAISEHVLSQAEQGDLDYIKFLYERLEGKPAQTVEVEQSVSVSLDEALLERHIRRLQGRLGYRGDVVDLEPEAE